MDPTTAGTARVTRKQEDAVGLLDKVMSMLGMKRGEAVEGPPGGPHPAPPEDTMDSPAHNLDDPRSRPG